MIEVTRINHVPLLLNADLIEHIESTPDTVISLTNGQKLMVLEDPQELVRRVIAFRRRIYQPEYLAELPVDAQALAEHDA